MFLAMNRFKVRKDRVADFEAVWLNRRSELPNIEGFVEFRLLRGPEQDDHILYSSHVFWETEASFVAWTESEVFRTAHESAGKKGAEPMLLGHPNFEGFSTLQVIDRDGVIA